jgi:hypothetical protein
MVGANDDPARISSTGPRHWDGGVQMIALDVTRIRFRRSDTERARTPGHMDHMVSMIYFQQTAWDGNENHPETVRTGTEHAKAVCLSCSRDHLI